MAALATKFDARMALAEEAVLVLPIHAWLLKSFALMVNAWTSLINA